MSRRISKSLRDKVLFPMSGSPGLFRNPKTHCQWRRPLSVSSSERVSMLSQSLLTPASSYRSRLHLFGGSQCRSFGIYAKRGEPQPGPTPNDELKFGSISSTLEAANESDSLAKQEGSLMEHREANEEWNKRSADSCLPPTVDAIAISHSIARNAKESTTESEIGESSSSLPRAEDVDGDGASVDLLDSLEGAMDTAGEAVEKVVDKVTDIFDGF